MFYVAFSCVFCELPVILDPFGLKGLQSGGKQTLKAWSLAGCDVLRCLGCLVISREKGKFASPTPF